MGIMVYSLLWVMQDFVHQPKEPLGLDITTMAECNGFLGGNESVLEGSWDLVSKVISRL